MALESGLLDAENVQGLIKMKNCEGKNCEYCPKLPTCYRWKGGKID